MSVFGLIALAGIVSREWALLHQPGALGRFFSGPGDFPPQAVVTAFLHGQSVVAAYAPVDLRQRATLRQTVRFSV
jgi:hypothetical protein